MRARGLPSYLSALHRERLATRTGTAPREERRRGALLFIDVSGFTRLTEQFALAGPRGAERLAGAFDVVFGGVFDRVLSGGGDVLAFAGDAVLALWLAEDASPAALGRAARRAERCGYETLARFHGHAVGQDHSLELRAALGAGNIDVLDVGGWRGRWECLVVGDALEQARLADGRTRPGSLEPSPEARALLDATPDPVAPSARTRGASVPPPRFEPSVPPIVRELEGAGQGDWIAEFRTATIVFLRFAGLERAGPGRCDLVDRAVRTAQEVVSERGGGVHQILADDKGVRLIAGFGLPKFSQPEDAARAVSATLELGKRLDELGVTSSAGIATGRLFCGTFGCEGRSEYAIRGSVVNRAARIMTAVERGVLCDRETVKAAGRRLAFVQADTLRLKGIAEPVPAFRPTSSAEVTPQPESIVSQEAPFVGRESEIARCIGRLEDLRQQGRGGVVRIVGDAGIGKSKLLTRVADHATKLGLRVLQSVGDPLEPSTAYLAWRGLLRKLLAPLASTTPESLRRSLEERLQSSAAMLPWVPLLSSMLSIEAPDNEVTRQMDAAARADATEQLVARLLAGETERAPVAIVVDDAHWVDSRSIALLQSVLRRVPLVLAFVATRPSRDPAAPSPWQEWDGGEALTLGPMETAEVRKILEHQIGAIVGADVASFVFERAEGHPLYARELARELVDARMLTVDAESCHLAGEAARAMGAAFPRSLEAVITSRIDRLSPAEQFVLKTASVLGRTFTVEAIDALRGGDETSALEPVMDLLRRVGVLRESREQGAWEFSHITMRDVAYDLLPFAQRKRLHARAAEWIERVHAEALDPFHALLAYHWTSAEQPRRAIASLEAAAEQAFRSFSNREVIAFLHDAIELSRSEPVAPAQRAQWEQMLGEASIKLARYDEARAHLLESLRLSGRTQPATPGALAASLTWEIGRQILHRRGPVRSRLSGDARDAQRRVAVSYHLLAEVGLYTHDRLGIVHSTLSSLNSGERGGSVREVIIGCGQVAYASGLAGLHGLARRYRRRSIEMAERDGNLATIAFTHQIAAAYGNCAGDWADVDASCKRAIELFELLGDRFRSQTCTAIHGYMHLARGDVMSAARCFDATLTSALPDGAAQVHMWAHAGQLLCGLAGGRAPVEAMREVERVLGRDILTAERILGLGALAQAHALRGDLMQAGHTARSALELMRGDPPATSYTLWSVAGVADVLLRLQVARVDGADDGAAREALSILRTAARAMPVARPHAELAQARTALASGRVSAARRHYAAARAHAERLGMPLEAATALDESTRLEAGYDAARARVFPPRPGSP